MADTLPQLGGVEIRGRSERSKALPGFFRAGGVDQIENAPDRAQRGASERARQDRDALIVRIEIIRKPEKIARADGGEAEHAEQRAADEEAAPGVGLHVAEHEMLRA